MKKLLIVAFALLFSTQTFAQTRDYAGLQDLLIKFYGYQRAGLKSGSCYNLNSGFANASHNGDNYNSNPLDGGWYDAGDYIKFGMNLGYAVYCLLKGYDVFPSGYANKYDWTHQKTDDIPDILNQVKFATDYMMKAVINGTTVVLDVGIASDEHDTWGVRYGSGRSGNQIRLCDGADIPATYAACLALMATLYKKYDAAYAEQCLTKAKLAFDFAKTKYNQGSYYCTAQLKHNKPLYDYPTVDGKKNQQINDRLVAAGVELYRATNNGDPTYKTWAQKSIPDYYNCMGYAYIGPLAAFEVWRQGLGSYTALSSNLAFIESKVKTSGVFNGIYQNSGWGTAREAGSAAFEYALGYVTTSSATTREKYLNRVKSHVDWVAGYSGTRSYICGFNNGPKKIHYRTTNYGPVPGGVVSGPDGDGKWDDNGSADFCEVAIDYNAGIIGALAFLKALNSTSEDEVKISTSFSATPVSDVDFTKNTVKISAGFSKSVAWTVKIEGKAGSKTFTGTGTSISQNWDGAADKGFFIGGEKVVASLSIDKNIAIFDVLKVNPFEIALSQTKKITPTESDKLLDNFEDSNLSPMLGSGKWIPFGTKTGISGTKCTTKTDNGSVALEVSGSVYTNDNKNWAGVKATFDAEGNAGNRGQIKSILFDLRCTKSANIRVELEQPSITDGAYFGMEVPVTTTSNRYRVEIKDFTQPDWKTSAKTIDLNSISSVRFTLYDSVSSFKMYLDNVYIEGLTTGVVNVSSKLLNTQLKPAVQNGSFVYSIPQNVVGNVDVSVFNIAGKVVMKEAINANTGKVVSIPLSKLTPGLYTVTNTVNGKVIGEKMKFVHSK